MSDPVDILHRLYVQSYTVQHLDFLATLFDTLLLEPDSLARHALCQAAHDLDTTAAHDILTEWVHDVYRCLAYMITYTDESPQAILKKISQCVHHALFIDIVQVTGRLSQWTQADQVRLERAYHQWTGSLPRVRYTVDADCLAGFKMRTHVIHVQRVCYDATLRGRLARFAHQVGTSLKAELLSQDH